MDLTQTMIQKAKDDEWRELLKKAKDAENSAALLALAKENSMEMTQEEADAAFADLHKTGELSDDELENVTGGCGGSKKPRIPNNPCCACRLWVCRTDHSTEVENRRAGTFTYDFCKICGERAECTTCQYGKRENGTWYCYNTGKTGKSYRG